MKKGDIIYTPRFCNVEIAEVYESKAQAVAAGYVEPTHYSKDGYGIVGKVIDRYCMDFAAYKTGQP